MLSLVGVIKIIGNRIGMENLILTIFIKFVPFLTLLFFFTIMYMLIPNTKVRFIPALISAMFIAMFFSGFQSLFLLLQDMVNAYNKIYGSFSVIFILSFLVKNNVVFYYTRFSSFVIFYKTESYIYLLREQRM